MADPKPKAKAQALDYYGEYGEGDYNYADYGEAGDYNYGQGESVVSDVIRDCKGISKLPRILLILPYTISCIKGSSDIPFISLSHVRHADKTSMTLPRKKQRSE